MAKEPTTNYVFDLLEKLLEKILKDNFNLAENCTKPHLLTQINNFMIMINA